VRATGKSAVNRVFGAATRAAAVAGKADGAAQEAGKRAHLGQKPARQTLPEWHTAGKPIQKGFPHMLVGYVRVSTDGDRQVLDLQLNPGVDERHLFEDHASSRGGCVRELRDRRFENQMFCPSGLNLLVTAIILWNSRYLAAAFESLRRDGQPLDPDIMKQVAPLGWQHISLTGGERRQPTDGQLRLLRRPPSLLAA
jgi:hypothetical protein